MLAANHLHKRFTAVHAVNNVTLVAQRGAIFGLLGPNGAGKSTTIRMINNIIQPDSGDIAYDGQPFSEGIRQRIGFLPEERGLYQKARILETILYFARLRGMNDRDARVRAAEWLRRFDLAGSERRKVEELSKGNQQKVQIVIALIHKPDYVILDEPASGLDPMNQELLSQIIEELRAENRVILYSTHQMDVAERICNRIALINKGQVVLEGDVDDVRTNHGSNSIHLEYQGDGAFLRELPMVAEAAIDSNFAELKVVQGTTVNDLLPHITDRLRLSRVELVRPSLRSIFIDTVKAKEGAQ
ncbi:MAG TPA: ATP-binding cassette domain-containing protein [Candidatus Kapabacteria bacterium]|nr:ATP-binding cassette domain-containing protein [Candidatus Kapabacteria bacterium]